MTRSGEGIDHAIDGKKGKKQTAALLAARKSGKHVASNSSSLFQVIR
jgi:hypothetical protein